nr:zinc finger, CCHC-type [Tanacetum cinerariifolium]
NTIEELARYEEEGWNDPIFLEEGSLNYINANIEKLLGVMECQIDTLMKDAISLMGKSGDVCGVTSNTMRQLPLEPSHQEEFKGPVTNFIRNQEEKVCQLEEYMCVIGKALRENASFHTPKIVSSKSLFVKYVHTIFLSPPLVRESTFGFKHGTNNNQNVKSRYDAENSSPQSSPQVILSFEVYTSPMTYPEEVKETIGITMEVEPLDHTKPEDLGLNTCSRGIFLSLREISSIDEPEPQLLPNFSPLDVKLGDKRGTDPPIKSHNPDSFRM